MSGLVNMPVQQRFELVSTLVLTICNFLGLDCGWSAAPTRAIRDVQKSISTMPRAPSSVLGYEWRAAGIESKMQNTLMVYTLPNGSQFVIL